MQVLLVEDNDDDVLLIQESLSETKISIARAERLSSALEQLAKGGFDAVLLDLPASTKGKSGEEVLYNCRC